MARVVATAREEKNLMKTVNEGVEQRGMMGIKGV